MKVKRMALIAMMGALSAVLMLVSFPLPFMPPFMDFDFAGVPEMIGGFALGWQNAIWIILVKLMIKLAIKGTSTMFTGELQNFLLSCAYVLPAVWYYQNHRTKKGAVRGMLLGTIICAAIAVLTNLTIIIPFYTKLLGNMTFNDIIAMCKAVNPLMSNVFGLAIFGIIPFNLIKNGVVSLVTFLLYKRISPYLKSWAGK